MTPQRRSRFALVFFLLGFAGCGLLGCGGDEPDRPVTTHSDVRGVFKGTATDGRDVVVHHEAIPGVMDAMVMTLPLADTAAARGLDKGDKIRFDLVIEGVTPRVENVEALPDSVTLDLDAPRDADTTGAPASDAGPDA